MDFPAWLASLGQRLDDIQAALIACETLTNSNLTSARALAAAATAFCAATTTAEGRSGHLYSCNTLAFDSMKELFSLYHDVEMVASWDFALARAGIDPAQVIQPIAGNVGGGMGYRLEQDGPLQIFPSPGGASDVVAPGQAGMAVPLKLKILNRDVQARLGLSCDLATLGASPAVVTLDLGRLPRITSTDPLAPALVFQMEDRAETEINTSIARARLMTPLLDILPRQPTFWGTYNDGLIRIAGYINRRSRSRRPFLPALPASYPVAIRFDLSVITSLVSQEIAAQGIRIFSGPAVTSDKTFRIVAGIQESYSIEIGCEVASADITIAVTVDTTLSVRLGNVLIVDASVVGAPDINVHVSPRIPILTNWVEGQIERIVRGFIPNIDGFQRQFFISEVSRFDIWLSNDYTLLGIEPR